MTTPGGSAGTDDAVEAQARPTVLIVYYTFSEQTQRVAEVIADELVERGADVTKARIELTDPRWAKRFETIPMRFPMIKIVGMLPAQVRQARGEIRIPPAAQGGDYDLVIVGSPTWWFRLSLPMRTYLTSAAAGTVLAGKPFAAYSTSRRYWRLTVGDIRRFGEAAGGTWLGETHFVAAGNQVQSMLAWLSFMSGLSVLDRLLRLPPTNLQPGFEAQARGFAAGVADRFVPGPAAAEG